MTQESIPLRKDISKENTWDLSKLFPNDEAWEAGLAEFVKQAEKIPSFKGTLGKSAESLAAWMDYNRDLNILGERLDYYSELRQAEDEGDSAARTMTGKFTMAAAKAHAASSWADPEIMAIPENDIKSFLAQPRLAEYRIRLNKLLRYREYTLSDKEERIIALQAEAEGIAGNSFSVLTNVDLDFGVLDTPEGKRPLSQSTWAVFMENPDRDIRKKA
ncbi:MAG: oligoendopeptidase F, partial [Treponema sp.]|nr:oligoendopeptidase F [Treponema sp.]